MPEDVGHAFVTWAPKFDSYVTYCTNKPHSTQLLVQHGGQYFEGLQRKFGLEHPIAAYLIKPVQVIKVEKILKCSLDLILSPSRSRESLNFLFLFFRQNIAGRCQQTLPCPISLLSTPSNVLPSHLKPTFLTII
jgi:hypothetical protein